MRRMRRTALITSLAVAGVALTGAVGDAQTSLSAFERIDVSSAGEPAEYVGLVPSVSADGRFVAFSSSGSTLVPGDTNGWRDVFLRDRQSRTTTRVSVATAGGPAGGDSDTPTISGDGRFVAFWSYATDLVPGDTNGAPDVFLHDRMLDETTRLSVGSDGEQATEGALAYPGISDDGRFVVFVSSSPDLVPGYAPKGVAVFLHDRRTGSTKAVHPKRPRVRASSNPSISADGRTIAFLTYRLRKNNSIGSVAVKAVHRRTGRVERVDVTPAGRAGNADAAPSVAPAISGNGRYVAFGSAASNLVADDRNGGEDAFVRDLRRDRTRLLSVRPSGAPLRRCRRDTSVGEQPDVLPCGTGPDISRNGRFVAFGAFTRSPDPQLPGWPGVYWRDLRSGDVAAVGTGSVVPENHLAISGDGRLVVFNASGPGNPGGGLYARSMTPSG